MDGAHERRSEHVGEIGGNGRETAAIHRGDDAKRRRTKTPSIFASAATRMPAHKGLRPA